MSIDKNLAVRHVQGLTAPPESIEPYIGQRDSVISSNDFTPAIKLPVLPVSDQERAACELMASRYPTSKIKGAPVPGKPHLPLISGPKVNAKLTLLQDAIAVERARIQAEIDALRGQLEKLQAPSKPKAKRRRKPKGPGINCGIME